MNEFIHSFTIHPFKIALHRVRQARKRKVPDLQRRNQIPPDTLGYPHRFEVIEHNDRAFVEAEILNGVLDDAVFDVEGTVAGQAGVEQRLWINGADVPEPRDQDTLFGVFNHLGQRLGTPCHDKT